MPELLNYLEKAIELDPDYSLKVYKDGVFEKFIKEIDEKINQMRISKRNSIEPELKKAKSKITQLEQMNMSKSGHYGHYLELKTLVQNAEKDFQTKTYIGMIDCRKKLNSL